MYRLLFLLKMFLYKTDNMVIKMMTSMIASCFGKSGRRSYMIMALVTALITCGNGLVKTAKADTLNIYSSRSPQLIQPLLDAYTDKTGTSFKVLHLSDGMAQRLKAEGDNTPADIVLTVDISRLSEIDDLGVLAAVDSPLLRANIPAKWRDTDHQWFGLSTRARVAVISTERVDANALKRIEDLADQRWRGRICSRKGSHPYNRALLASLVAHMGLMRHKNGQAD